MKLPEVPGANGERRYGATFIYSLIGVSLVVLLILAVVIGSNRNKNSLVSRPDGRVPQAAGDGGDEPTQVHDPPANGNLRPGDLDFWDMYPEGDDNPLGGEELQPQEPAESPPPPPLPPSEDGRHTLVERRDGSSDWIRLVPYITRNNYDPLGFVLRRDRMAYYENDRPVTFFGVDLSRYDGTPDFYLMKNDGVDFVMLRLGARGYESGELSLDDNFFDNLDAAEQNGLDVGVYFFSQATSREEAIEEATLVITSLADKKISYPVVFSMDFIAFDTSRIDTLTRAEKTEIADAFCNFIKGAGYVPMIYGTKEWLVEQIDLTQLMSYDIWLSQVKDLPDYPYKFQIWQYSHSGKVAGVNGNASMNVSFVDFGAR